MLAVLLTLPLAVLARGAQGNGAQVVITGVVWSPALAAVVTVLLFRDDIGALGWRWCSWRYIRWALIIPVLYVVPAYLVVWVLGLGGFYNVDFVGTVTRNYGFSGVPTGAGFVGYLLLTLTAGLIMSVGHALGEEIGWRGFLVPQLAKVTNFTGLGLISGLMWSAWHLPWMLISNDNLAGTPAWYGLTCFTVMATSLGFIAAWLRLRSGSLWPAVIVHAMHNTIVQDIVTPMTTNTGHTDWYIDEFGAALAVATLIGAIIVWRKAVPSPP